MRVLSALAALALVAAALPLAGANAGDHPKTTTEHPATTTEPPSGEHPSKAADPASAEQPVGEGTIIAIASASEDFTTLVKACTAAGLVETLQGNGPFTVFAPTNAAFAKLPQGTLESLLQPENKDQLVAILAYHVIPGRVTSADVKTSKVKTVNGLELNIEVGEHGVSVGNAKVVKADIVATNGVIHVVDDVMLPAAAGSGVPAGDVEKAKPKDHPGH